MKSKYKATIIIRLAIRNYKSITADHIDKWPQSYIFTNVKGK